MGVKVMFCRQATTSLGRSNPNPGLHSLQKNDQQTTRDALFYTSLLGPHISDSRTPYGSPVRAQSEEEKRQIKTKD